MTLRFRSGPGRLLAPVLAALVLALRGAPPALTVVVGCVAYPVLLRILGGITDEELRILGRIVAAPWLTPPAAHSMERES